MASRLLRCSTDPKQNQEAFRYLNKNTTEGERNLYHLYWDEMVNLYGTRVEYFTYQYDTSLSGHNPIYGEHTTANFTGPIVFNMLVNIPSESLMLSKFGYDMNADFTGVVTVADWRRIFGTSINAEPKSGDVIRLFETGWRTPDAPDTTANLLSAICSNRTPAQNATLTTTVSDYDWIRCPWIFEITERDHQDFSAANNMLLGHYIWVLKGKRFDFSYQPGIDQECHMGDVGEEKQTGILPGGSQPESPAKDYPGNVDDISNEIWNYDDGYTKRPTKEYGGY
jgi:hypothetical protein